MSIYRSNRMVAEAEAIEKLNEIPGVDGQNDSEIARVNRWIFEENRSKSKRKARLF